MVVQDDEGSPGLGWRIVAGFVAGIVVGALSMVEVIPRVTGAAGSGQGGQVYTQDGPVPQEGAAAQEGAAGSTGSGSTGGSTASGGGGGVGGGSAGASGQGAGTGAGTGSGSGDQTGSAGGSDQGAGTGSAGDPSSSSLSCAGGRNGGSTDQGVSATQVMMATTVVDSGIGAAFLRDVRFAMDAVRNDVNRRGGICGRHLVIRYVDDGWDAQRGAQYLRNFIQERVFAIPVGPSSEGLGVVIDSGDIDRARMPVVGTDGLRQDQYVRGSSAQPWVWPVATATVSSARIMASWAYGRGARRFSIVFDRNYRFGVEGAAAFNEEVKRLTGRDIPGYNTNYNCQQAFCGVIAGQSSYSSDVAEWRPHAGDFVALFLEPQTALAWMNDPNTPAANSGEIKYGYAGAQPMFTRGFAVDCQSKCDQMWLWTGFKPYIESYQNDPAVRAYVDALKRTNPQADEYNAFAQGGYVGMLLLVEAMKQVGPNLTRAGLKRVLDRLCVSTGLTIQEKICYTPNNRFANITMQAFQIQYKGTFGGWRAGPIVKDPRA